MDKLKEIISDYVGVPKDQINTQMSLNGDIGLDSFGMISLVCNLENEFDVSIPEYELTNFQTLNDLASYLAQNSKNFATV